MTYVLEYLIMVTEEHCRIEDYIIAKEKHDDGTDHLHVYLSMAKKLNIKSSKFFDIEDDNGTVYHGNY